MFFNQCHLIKGNKHQTAYIPSKYAKLGKVLRLLEEDGWVVKEVYGRVSGDIVLRHLIYNMLG